MIPSDDHRSPSGPNREHRHVRAAVEAGASARQAPNGKPFHVRIRAATEGLARDGGIIPLAAWEDGLANFRKNPVVMLSHGGGFPLGISVHDQLDRAEGALVSHWLFHEESEESRLARRLYEAGHLRAASVGFRLLQWHEPNDAERERLRQEHDLDASAEIAWVADRAELLEESVVGVPSDPDAVADLDRALRRGTVAGLDTRALEPALHELQRRCEEGDAGACRRLAHAQRGAALAVAVMVGIENGELPEGAVVTEAAAAAGVEVSEVEAVLDGACPQPGVLEGLAEVLPTMSVSDLVAAAVADGCEYDVEEDDRAGEPEVQTDADGTRYVVVELDGETLEVELADGETLEKLAERVARRARLIAAGAHLPSRRS